MGLPRLARSLLILTGSCRIYNVFRIKAGLFVSVLVKMGLSRSLLRAEFSLYRAQAKGTLRYGDYGLRLRINMLLRMIRTT